METSQAKHARQAQNKSFYLCRWVTLKYRKNPKISDPRKFAVITLKVEQNGFSLK